MAVQYSIQKMVSDGTLSTIALGIQYLQRNDIYIRIAGEETPQSGAPSGYTWSFLDNTTLKILPVVPNGVEVVVYRRTDVDAMYNIYSQNAQFDEATIDENNQQLLYIAQEYLEQGLPGAGIDIIEFLRDDGLYTYYRIKRTDGSYSDEFPVPSAGSAARVLVREALRRSYAEVGLNLVHGTFQSGFTLHSPKDVALDEASGKAYSHVGPYPVTVGAGSSVVGFVDESGRLLRDEVFTSSPLEGAPSQYFLCEPFLGFADDATSTEIFPGAGSTSQGVAFAKVGTVEKMFILQKVSGDTNKASERQRIVEYNIKRDGTVVNAVSFSAELALGHQSISAIVRGSDVFLYGVSTTVSGREDNDAGKGFSRIAWNGAQTSQADVVNYQLWGYQDSDHRFKSVKGATSCVSTDGKYLIMVGTDVEPAGSASDVVNILFVYNLAEVEAASNPLDVNPIYKANLPAPSYINTLYNQGAACDGKFVYILRGYSAPLQQCVIQKFDFSGNLILEAPFDGVRGKYGIDSILNNDSLGTPYSFEPEGIALNGNEIIVLFMDNWASSSQVVSYEGANWASTKDNNIGNSPRLSDYWVATKKAATAGEWNATTTYNKGATSSRRSKMIYSIKEQAEGVVGPGLCAGITAKTSGASVVCRSNPVDVSFDYGENFQVQAYSENTGRYYPAFEYASGQFFRIFDQTENGGAEKYSYLGAQLSSGREVLEIRARDAGLVNGAGINLCGNQDSISPGKVMLISTTGAAQFEMHLQSNGTLRPGVTDAQDLGTQTQYRMRRGYFNEVYVGPSGSNIKWVAGDVAPNGNVTASVGSLYSKTSAPVGLFFKETGTGNTGWVQK